MRHRVNIAAVTAVFAIGLVTAPAALHAQTIAPAPVAQGQRSTAPTRAASSIGGLVDDVFTDFSRLPSWQTLAILTAGGVGAAIGHPADNRLSQELSRSARMKTMLGSGETLGGARVQVAGALTTYALGRITNNSKVTTIGADLIRSHILTQAMTATIKTAVNRGRPDGDQFSFPSGHASMTFATATVLQRNLGWKAGLPAYGFATYVAASRIQSKRHFLSDVTFGAAIGIVAGRTATIGRGNAKFSIAPAAAPGGAGIQFSWVGRN